MTILADSLIRPVTVDLGPVTVRIPVVRIQGYRDGPALLVTAGVDGDEYAGIAAAYRIIREFSRIQFRGSLTVIPIVNIPGFYAKTSKNPLDGAYPKYIFPGKIRGTPSERLCYWLYTYTLHAQFWLDMHSGAQSERLTPFVGSWASGSTSIDALVRKVIDAAPSRYASFEPSIPAKTQLLATHGCAYLLAESGELGLSDAVSVGRHVRWARCVASVLGMTNEKFSRRKKTIFTHIVEFGARHSGLWFPSYTKPRLFKRGEILGEIRRENGTLREKILCTRTGAMLWGKVGMRAEKGDILAGLGYDVRS